MANSSKAIDSMAIEALLPRLPTIMNAKIRIGMIIKMMKMIPSTRLAMNRMIRPAYLGDSNVLDALSEATASRCSSFHSKIFTHQSFAYQNVY